MMTPTSVILSEKLQLAIEEWGALYGNAGKEISCFSEFLTKNNNKIILSMHNMKTKVLISNLGTMIRLENQVTN